VGLVVDKVALGQVFPPSTSVFACQFHSTGAPLHGKTKKKLIIFITGLHNKPQGCGASVASAAGPFTRKKKFMLMHAYDITDRPQLLYYLTVQLNEVQEPHFHRKIMSCHIVRKNLKIKMNITTIFPIVLYGCETWSHTDGGI
jgi:hypothetical protein